jgi:hypothetical protein
MALDGGTPRLRHRPKTVCLTEPTVDKLFLTYLSAYD